MDEAFLDHIRSGLTTLAGAWAITRADGLVLGFTDHDLDLVFDGITFRAESGLSATALQQGTGLSVDNAEALGALSDARISEADIDAGRYDGAELRAWIVNWADTGQRHLRFRGTIGEIRRAGGAFRAELRGLTEALNRPVGRVFQKPCTAVLGDRDCRVDLTTRGYAAEAVLRGVDEESTLMFDALPGYAPGWFRRGQLEVQDGAARGLHAQIRRDEVAGAGREIALWAPLRAGIAAGDRVRLVAGCDKRLETCRFKFDNILNFQGFPDLPSEDWLMAVPARSGDLGGGSRR
ncbi:phage conserved hypothetical protein BR0599 [Lutimaribacter pacificus]|uniref:Bacteriophage phiJL001 Gp84 C-terminal domain-containing protein n=1 Tax=Lutimaribacter pacificus TaxID=391948 RepID=A0A1H0AM76_9RHOB|nr:DUF2163 domain-containing protein [Lutimaribacter pacificus]SDN34384.1 phage conserved hypothetical protein BR0599 [Lutimaribacter pacificus]SHJ67531.1 phage conserved hypothetical protein BR0599 [Lutimaribacter pacificus]